MSEIQTVQPAFVAYRAGTLREGFKKAIAYHTAQTEAHPMGLGGFHETMKNIAEESLEALNSQTMNDSDILTFPTLLLDFTKVIAPSGPPLASFLDYHRSGRIGLIMPREVNQLGLIRSLS